VRAGDAVLVPAGLPHAIGDGVLLVEVQEPTDFSVLLEQEGFPVDPADALLGLPRDQALACVDRSGWGPDRVAALRDAGRPRGTRPGVRRLFPEAADEFFAAELLRPDPVSVLDPGFSVLVVTAGRGVLEPEAGPAAPLPMADLPMADLPMADLPVAEGDTLVVPYAAGGLTLRGDVAAIRARPA
jgi:mannose-6-phosphate isomerase